MRRYVLRATTAALLLIAAPATGQDVGDTIKGKAETIDGVSLRVGENVVRLFGINAIEASNPLSPKGAERLNKFATLGEVVCKVHSIDDNGGLVAMCLVLAKAKDRDTVFPVDLNASMVQMGWATNADSLTDKFEATEAEAEARQRCKGAWAALPECK